MFKSKHILSILLLTLISNTTRADDLTLGLNAIISENGFVSLQDGGDIVIDIDGDADHIFTSIARLPKADRNRISAIYLTAPIEHESTWEKFSSLSPERLGIGPKVKWTQSAAKAIAKFSELTSLASESDPSSEGLADVIKGCRHLYVLTLQDVDLRQVDLSPLAGAEELTVLRLLQVKITSKHLEWLPKSKSLHELDLRGTKVGDRAVPFIIGCAALKEVNWLQTKISVEGCDAIDKAMDERKGRK